MSEKWILHRRMTGDAGAPGRHSDVDDIDNASLSARVRSILTRQDAKLERRTWDRSTMCGRIFHQQHRKDHQSAHELMSPCTSLQRRAAGLSRRLG